MIIDPINPISINDHGSVWLGLKNNSSTIYKIAQIAGHLFLTLSIALGMATAFCIYAGASIPLIAGTSVLTVAIAAFGELMLRYKPLNPISTGPREEHSSIVPLEPTLEPVRDETLSESALAANSEVPHSPTMPADLSLEHKMQEKARAMQDISNYKYGYSKIREIYSEDLVSDKEINALLASEVVKMSYVDFIAKHSVRVLPILDDTNICHLKDAFLAHLESSTVSMETLTLSPLFTALSRGCVFNDAEQIKMKLMGVLTREAVFIDSFEEFVKTYTTDIFVCGLPLNTSQKIRQLAADYVNVHIEEHLTATYDRTHPSLLFYINECQLIPDDFHSREMLVNEAKTKRKIVVNSADACLREKFNTAITALDGECSLALGKLNQQADIEAKSAKVQQCQERKKTQQYHVDQCLKELQDHTAKIDKNKKDIIRAKADYMWFQSKQRTFGSARLSEKISQLRQDIQEREKIIQNKENSISQDSILRSCQKNISELYAAIENIFTQLTDEEMSQWGLVTLLCTKREKQADLERGIARLAKNETTSSDCGHVLELEIEQRKLSYECLEIEELEQQFPSIDMANKLVALEQKIKVMEHKANLMEVSLLKRKKELTKDMQLSDDKARLRNMRDDLELLVKNEQKLKEITNKFNATKRKLEELDNLRKNLSIELPTYTGLLNEAKQQLAEATKEHLEALKEEMECLTALNQASAEVKGQFLEKKIKLEDQQKEDLRNLKKQYHVFVASIDKAFACTKNA